MNIDGWLINVCKVEPRIGVDGYGAPIYGAQITVLARVEVGFKLVLGHDGANLNSTHWMTTKVQINPDDRVWLPGDDISDATKARRPLMINNAETKPGDFTLYETFFA